MKKDDLLQALSEIDSRHLQGAAELLTGSAVPHRALILRPIAAMLALAIGIGIFAFLGWRSWTPEPTDPNIYVPTTVPETTSPGAVTTNPIAPTDPVVPTDSVVPTVPYYPTDPVVPTQPQGPIDSDPTPIIYCKAPAPNWVPSWNMSPSSLTCATYQRARITSLSSGQVKNVTLPEYADSKVATDGCSSLLDVSYTVEGEHARCFGVYLDVHTQQLICLQHEIHPYAPEPYGDWQVRVLEFGINRNYCLFRFTKCSYLTSDKTLDPNSFSSIYLFDRTQGVLIDTDIEITGNITTFASSADYSLVLAFERGLQAGDNPRILRFEQGKTNVCGLFGDERDDSVYLMEQPFFTPSERFGVFHLIDSSTEQEFWLAWECATGAISILPEEPIRFLKNDSYAILVHRGVCDCDTWQTSGEVMTVLPSERMAWDLTEGKLYCTDLLAGTKSRMDASGITDYTVSADGAYVYWYSLGDGQMFAYEVDTGILTQFSVDRGFVGQVRDQGQNRRVSTRILIDAANESIDLLYFSWEDFTFGTMREYEEGTTVYLEHDYSPESFFYIFSKQLWRGGSVCGQQMHISTSSVKQLALLAAELLKYEIYEAAEDGLVDSREYETLRELYHSRVEPFVDIRSNGTVLVNQSEYLKAVGAYPKKYYDSYFSDYNRYMQEREPKGT